MNICIFEKMLICAMLIILFSVLVFSPQTFAISDVFSYGKGFIEKGNNINETIDTGVLKSTSDFLYKVLLAIAVVIAIVVALILGIQFMWTSAEEKAKVKEALLPFVVGCFVVFGSFTIWKIAVNVGNDAESEVSGKDYISDARIENSKLLDRVQNGGADHLSKEDLIQAYTVALGVQDFIMNKMTEDPRAGRKR